MTILSQSGKSNNIEIIQWTNYEIYRIVSSVDPEAKIFSLQATALTQPL